MTVGREKNEKNIGRERGRRRRRKRGERPWRLKDNAKNSSAAGAAEE
ncbi:hypothetical protein MJA45_03535 [Paenibacillus aurantius]|uniref:Uncharacterized protein n=1 Tax=Paenibacillus aurantius TaxID=2918900 RepID=A0AA96RGB0_9BACL|nr:hypothetical protein [Paenibacillus aurantius]WNQ12133.1 hypothetical protein MJA45_03535 [Paenibacillus aurantius]